MSAADVEVVRRIYREGYVWQVRDGRAVRFAWFNDPAAALAAAGVEPAFSP